MSEYYRYLKYQKYINGVPLDEYKQGDLIGVVEADSQSDCEQGVEYRWVATDLTMCDGYAEYLKEVKQKFIDDRWQDTSEYRKGQLIEAYSQNCGVVWKYRWQDTGLIKCSGYLAAKEYVYQVSKDMGNTWLNVEPAQYKYENIEGESFNYDCVILTAPLEITINSNSDIGVWINNDSYFSEGTISGIPMMYGEGFRYVVDWGEGSPPILHVPDEKQTNREKSSMYKIPKHSYITPGTYKVKIWGSIGAITDFSEPYTINAWGKGYGTSTKAAFKIMSWTVPDLKYGSAYVFSYLKEGKYLSYIEIGENCLGFPEWSEGLTDNNTFKCNSTKFTDLKLDFTKMWTSYLFINCPNLTVTPKLCPKVNGIPNAYKMVSFEGCSKLTETPQGGMISNLFNDRILTAKESSLGSAIAPNYIGGDYKNAFKGCTALTKINGPIVTFTSDFMFEGCTGLTNLNNLEMKIDSTIGMFKDCTNLTGQYTLRQFEKAEGETENTDTFLCWFRNSMFENTKVSYIDPKMISSITVPYTTSSYRYTISTERMFYNTPVTKVSFNLNESDLVLYNMKEMFSHSTANNIDGLFLGLKSYPIMDRMFENCDITNLEGVFNYDTSYFYYSDGNRYSYPIKWKYLYPMESEFRPDYTREYLYTTSSIYEMFKGCASLTNYPTYNNYPMWFWPNLYKDSTLLVTLAFLGCKIIAPEVPPEWGGLKFAEDSYELLAHISSETNYILGMFLDKGSLIINWGDDTMDIVEGSTPSHSNAEMQLFRDDSRYDADTTGIELKHYYSTAGVYTIKFLELSKRTETLECYFDPTAPTDFVKLGTANYVNFMNSNNVVSLGLITSINTVETNLINHCYNISDALISPKLKIHTLDIHIIDVPSVWNEKGIQNIYLELAYIKCCSNIVDFSNSFKGCTNLSRCDLSSNSTLILNGTFKDCSNLKLYVSYTKITDMTDAFNNTSISTVRVGVSIDYIPVLNAEKAVRAYANCYSLDPVLNLEAITTPDMTECFMNTPITTVNIGEIAEGVNLTRCFMNCKELDSIPKVGNKYLWEIPGLIGTECFKGCTKLDMSIIPDDWK